MRTVLIVLGIIVLVLIIAEKTGRISGTDAGFFPDSLHSGY